MNPYGGGGDPNWVANALAQFRAEFYQKLNQQAEGMRRFMGERGAQLDQKIRDLAVIAGAMDISRAASDGVIYGGKIVRIEDIPGRRVPYDLSVDIPIGNNETSQQQGSITISQDGPFVAQCRYIAFQSNFQFSVEGDGGAQALFAGRSFGRYRPTSSTWDFQDARGDSVISLALPLPGNLSVVGAPGLTSSQSGFRTMEFDGRVFVENAGSGYPRQNQSVPSQFWSRDLTGAVDLPALDFFERGEVINFNIQPNHVNNPPAGNADGLAIFGTTGWPFLDGQYDKHEGIVTPGAFSTSGATPPVTTRLAADIISRLPNGIITIGYFGYRIQQPPGPIG
jgi:hypothetical protein